MRIQKTPFGNNPFKRGVAILTVALFLSMDLFNYVPAVFAQSINPNVQGGNPSNDLSRLVRDAEIRIPPELGTVDEVYRVERGTGNGERENRTFARSPFAVPRHDRMVVYIQDAHDSLEAQENIAKMINHLVANYGVKTVFEEGYEGPVPTDKYFGFIKDPKIREKVAYFLMDRLRIGGAEYAHINRKRSEGGGRMEEGAKSVFTPSAIHHPSSDFNLIGADSIKLHKENIDQYRFSAAKKDAVTKDLKALERELKALADSRFPKELKEWLKTKAQFDAKRLDLFTYLGRTALLFRPQTKKQLSTVDRGPWTGLLSFILEAIRSNDPVVIEKAKHIDAREVFDELVQLEQTVAETYLKNDSDKILFSYYKILTLLDRLNDLQVSQEEYEAVKTSLETFDTQSFARFIFNQSPKTLILSRMWEQNIKDAIKFYEIAAARDNSIAKRLDEFLAVSRSPSPAPAVLVYGGFHKEAIKRILEAKNISYLVVSPRITKPSLRHEQFYKKLMSEGRFSYELLPTLRVATRAESRIEIWDRNPALAVTELGIMASVARDMPSADSRSLGLAVEHALETSENYSSVDSDRLAKSSADTGASENAESRPVAREEKRAADDQQKQFESQPRPLGKRQKKDIGGMLEFKPASQFTEGELFGKGVAAVVAEAQKEKGFWKGWIPEFWNGRGADALVVLRAGAAMGVWACGEVAAGFIQDNGLYVFSRARGEGLGNILRRAMITFLKNSGHDWFRIGAPEPYNWIPKDPGVQKFHEEMAGWIGVTASRDTHHQLKYLLVHLPSVPGEMGADLNKEITGDEKTGDSHLPGDSHRSEARKTDVGPMTEAEAVSFVREQYRKASTDASRFQSPSRTVELLGLSSLSKDRRLLMALGVDPDFSEKINDPLRVAHKDLLAGTPYARKRSQYDDEAYPHDWTYITFEFAKGHLTGVMIAPPALRNFSDAMTDALAVFKGIDKETLSAEVGRAGSPYEIGVRDELVVTARVIHEALRAEMGTAADHVRLQAEASYFNYHPPETLKGLADQKTSFAAIVETTKADDSHSDGGTQSGSEIRDLDSSYGANGYVSRAPELISAISAEMVDLGESSPILSWWKSQLAELARKKGERLGVLSVGFGFGDLEFALAQEGYDVLGVDAFKPHVDQAQQKILESWGERVRKKGGSLSFQFGDAEQLANVPDHSVRVAILSEMVGHFNARKGDDWQLRTVFEKIHSKLEPGGTVIITNYLTKKTVSGVRADGRWVEYTDEDIQAALEQAGFQHVVHELIKADKFIHDEAHLRGFIATAGEPHAKISGDHSEGDTQTRSEMRSDLDEKESAALAKDVVSELQLQRLQTGWTENPFHFTASYGGHSYLSEGYNVDGSDHYDFMRLRHLFFMDGKLYARLSPGLRERLGGNVIVIPDFRNNVLAATEENRVGFKFYTAAVILAMLNTDLKGTRFVDAGAGDGILSLVASKLGAAEVILIEKEGSELTKARKNLEQNDLRSGKDFLLIHESLENRAKIIRQIPPSKRSVAMAVNIGRWPTDYVMATNESALRLIPEFDRSSEKVSTVILGGYALNLGKSDKSEFGEHGPESDIAFLKKLGFSVQRARARSLAAISMIAERSRSEIHANDSEVENPSTEGFEAPGKYKVVFFDIGNVLLRGERAQTSRILMQYCDKSESEISAAMESGTSKDKLLYEKGLLSNEEFFQKIKDKLGLSMDYETFARAYTEKFTPIEENVKILRQLKAAGYKIGVISEIGRMSKDYVRSKYADIFGMADWFLASCDLRMMKDDPAIFDKALEVSGFPAGEAVFIDDFEKNVGVAAMRGITGVQFVPGQTDLFASLKNILSQPHLEMRKAESKGTENAIIPALSEKVEFAGDVSVENPGTGDESSGIHLRPAGQLVVLFLWLNAHYPDINFKITHKNDRFGISVLGIMQWMMAAILDKDTLRISITSRKYSRDTLERVFRVLNGGVFTADLLEDAGTGAQKEYRDKIAAVLSPDVNTPVSENAAAEKDFGKFDTFERKDVNTTYPLRRDDQLQYVRRLLPLLISSKQKQARGPTTIEVWSLGGSTGEEATSLATVIYDEIAKHPQWGVEFGKDVILNIKAVDSDAEIIEKAKKNMVSGFRAGDYGEPSTIVGRRMELEDKLEFVNQFLPKVRNTIEFINADIRDEALLARAAKSDIVFINDVLDYLAPEETEQVFKSLSKKVGDSTRIVWAGSEGEYELDGASFMRFEFLRRLGKYFRVSKIRPYKGSVILKKLRDITAEPQAAALLNPDLRHEFDPNSQVSPDSVNRAEVREGDEARITEAKGTVKYLAEYGQSKSSFSEKIKGVFAHTFDNWRNQSVFRFPVTRVDHPVLFAVCMGGLGFCAAVAISVGVFSPYLCVLVPIVFPIGFFIILFWSLPHVTEMNDALMVVRNAQQFQKDNQLVFDARLKKMAEKFEKETGWNIVWIRDSYTLAKVDQASRTVYLSIGWVLKNERAKDDRRLAYLTDVLRKIERAIFESSRNEEGVRAKAGDAHQENDAVPAISKGDPLPINPVSFLQDISNESFGIHQGWQSPRSEMRAEGQQSLGAASSNVQDNKSISSLFPEQIVIYHKKSGETTEKGKKNSIWENLSSELQNFNLLTPLMPETEGLVMLTTNPYLGGDMRAVGARFPEAYEVTVEGSVRREQIQEMENGIEVKVARKINGPTISSWIKPDDIDVLTNEAKETRMILRFSKQSEKEIYALFDIFGYRVKGVKRTEMFGLKLGDLNSGNFRRLMWDEVASLSEMGSETPLPVDAEMRRRSVRQETEDYKVIEFLLKDRGAIRDAFQNIFMRSDLNLEDVYKEDIYYVREGGFKRVYKVTLKLKDRRERFSFFVKVVKPDVIKTDSGYEYNETFVRRIIDIARSARQVDLDLYPPVGGYYVVPDPDKKDRIIYTEGAIVPTNANLPSDKADQIMIRTYLMYYAISGGKVFFEDPKPGNVIIHRRHKQGYKGTLIDLDNAYYEGISEFKMVYNLILYGFKPKDIIEAMVSVLGSEKAHEVLLSAAFTGRTMFRSVMADFIDELDRRREDLKNNIRPPMELRRSISVIINGKQVFMPEKTTLLEVLNNYSVDLRGMTIEVNGQLQSELSGGILSFEEKKSKYQDTVLKNEETLSFYHGSKSSRVLPEAMSRTLAGIPDLTFKIKILSLPLFENRFKEVLKKLNMFSERLDGKLLAKGANMKEVRSLKYRIEKVMGGIQNYLNWHNDLPFKDFDPDIIKLRLSKIDFYKGDVRAQMETQAQILIRELKNLKAEFEGVLAMPPGEAKKILEDNAKLTAGGNLRSEVRVVSEEELSFLDYYKAIKSTVNPKDENNLTALYAGSGSDIRSFLFSFNAAKAYFVDSSPLDARKFFQGAPLPGRAELSIYEHKKKRLGFGPSEATQMDDIGSKIIRELQELGAQMQSEDITENTDGSISIKFQWAYPGQKPREYAITFISVDITKPDRYPQRLKDVLGQGIDIYYQKSGYHMLEKSDSFMPLIASRIKPGGFSITDDELYTRKGQFEDANLNKYLPGFTGRGRLISDELVRAENVVRNYQLRKRDIFHVDYGWHVWIRQKTSDATTAAVATNADLKMQGFPTISSDSILRHRSEARTSFSSGGKKSPAPFYELTSKELEALEVFLGGGDGSRKALESFGFYFRWETIEEILRDLEMDHQLAPDYYRLKEGERIENEADMVWHVYHELANNANHAGPEAPKAFVVRKVTAEGQRGIEMIFRDGGPGIPSISAAVETSWSSTGKAFRGKGLPWVSSLLKSEGRGFLDIETIQEREAEARRFLYHPRTFFAEEDLTPHIRQGTLIRAVRFSPYTMSEEIVPLQPRASEGMAKTVSSNERSESRQKEIEKGSFATNFLKIDNLRTSQGLVPVRVSSRHSEIVEWLESLQRQGTLDKKTTIINFDTHPDTAEEVFDELNAGTWVRWIKLKGISEGRVIWVKGPASSPMTRGMRSEELRYGYGSSKKNIFNSVSEMAGKISGPAVITLDLDFLAPNYEGSVSREKLQARIDEFIQAVFASGIKPVAFHISVSPQHLATLQEYLAPNIELVIPEMLGQSFLKAGMAFERTVKRSEARELPVPASDAFIGETYAALHGTREGKWISPLGISYSLDLSSLTGEDDSGKRRVLLAWWLDQVKSVFAAAKKIQPGLTQEKFSILELGSGDGYLARELAKKRYSITGMDFVKTFVKVSKKANLYPKNLRFIRGDATNLDGYGDFKGVPDASFDLVISNEWLGNVPIFEDQARVKGKKEKRRVQPVFHEIFRKLKPGGVYILNDYHEKTNRSGVAETSRDSSSWWIHYSVADRIRALQKAGFVNVLDAGIIPNGLSNNADDYTHALIATKPLVHSEMRDALEGDTSLTERKALNKIRIQTVQMLSADFSKEAMPLLQKYLATTEKLRAGMMAGADVEAALADWQKAMKEVGRGFRRDVLTLLTKRFGIKYTEGYDALPYEMEKLQGSQSPDPDLVGRLIVRLKNILDESSALMKLIQENVKQEGTLLHEINSKEEQMFREWKNAENVRVKNIFKYGRASEMEQPDEISEGSSQRSEMRNKEQDGGGRMAPAGRTGREGGKPDTILHPSSIFLGRAVAMKMELKFGDKDLYYQGLLKSALYERVRPYSDLEFIVREFAKNSFDAILDKVLEAGIKPEDYDGRVSIDLKYEGNDLVITSTDNGKPIEFSDDGSPAERERDERYFRHNHRAISTILAYLNKVNGTISYLPSELGTQIKVRIPVQNLPEGFRLENKKTGDSHRSELRAANDQQKQLEGELQNKQKGVQPAPDIFRTTPGVKERLVKVFFFTSLLGAFILPLYFAGAFDWYINIKTGMIPGSLFFAKAAALDAVTGMIIWATSDMVGQYLNQGRRIRFKQSFILGFFGVFQGLSTHLLFNAIEIMPVLFPWALAQKILRTGVALSGGLAISLVFARGTSLARRILKVSDYSNKKEWNKAGDVILAKFAFAPLKTFVVINMLPPAIRVITEQAWDYLMTMFSAYLMNRKEPVFAGRFSALTSKHTQAGDGPSLGDNHRSEVREDDDRVLKTPHFVPDLPATRTNVSRAVSDAIAAELAGKPTGYLVAVAIEKPVERLRAAAASILLKDAKNSAGLVVKVATFNDDESARTRADVLVLKMPLAAVRGPLRAIVVDVANHEASERAAQLITRLSPYARDEMAKTLVPIAIRSVNERKRARAAEVLARDIPKEAVRHLVSAMMSQTEKVKANEQENAEGKKEEYEKEKAYLQRVKQLLLDTARMSRTNREIVVYDLVIIAARARKAFDYTEQGKKLSGLVELARSIDAPYLKSKLREFMEQQNMHPRYRKVLADILKVVDPDYIFDVPAKSENQSKIERGRRDRVLAKDIARARDKRSIDDGEKDEETLSEIDPTAVTPEEDVLGPELEEIDQNEETIALEMAETSDEFFQNLLPFFGGVEIENVPGTGLAESLSRAETRVSKQASEESSMMLKEIKFEGEVVVENPGTFWGHSGIHARPASNLAKLFRWLKDEYPGMDYEIEAPKNSRPIIVTSTLDWILAEVKDRDQLRIRITSKQYSLETLERVLAIFKSEIFKEKFLSQVVKALQVYPDTMGEYQNKLVAAMGAQSATTLLVDGDGLKNVATSISAAERSPAKAETRDQLENRMKQEFAQYGITYKYVESGSSGRSGNRIKLQSLPQQASWIMDALRPVNERAPIMTTFETMPVVSSVFDQAQLPLLDSSGTNSQGIFLGMIKGESGEVHPAAIKMCDVELKELKAIQIFGNRLGVFPEFYGVLKDENGKITGYAMSLVAIDKMRSVPMDHPDEREIKRRVGENAFVTTLFTRKDRAVGIDAGVISEEASDRQIEKSKTNTIPGVEKFIPAAKTSDRASPGLELVVAGSTATAVKPWQVLQLKQDIIMVLEQSRIDALSPEMYMELLKIAGLNQGKLHLVIPDALQGKYSERVAELRKVASVYDGFPQVAASDKIPVIGFSDMDSDTLEAFQKRVGPRLAKRLKDSAFGLNRSGSFGVGILYALKDIPPDQLRPNENGFRYDRSGWYSAQVLEVLQAYVAISIAA